VKEARPGAASRGFAAHCHLGNGPAPYRDLGARALTRAERLNLWVASISNNNNNNNNININKDNINININNTHHRDGKRSINIGGDPNDPYYRYKRYKSDIQHRGGTTIVGNLAEIAADLRVPIDVVVKYISIDLGTKARVGKQKKPTRSKPNKAKGAVMLSGRFSVNDIEKRLESITNLLVLCSRCRDPGTRLETKGSKLKHAELILRCGACGHKSAPHKTHKSLKAITRLVWDAERKDLRARSEQATTRNSSRRHKATTTTPARDDLQNRHERTTGSQSGPAEVIEEEKWFTDSSKESRAKRLVEEFGGVPDGGGLFEIQ